MKNSKSRRIASLLVAGASLLSISLSACTPADKPTEADKTTSSVATVSPDAPNSEKAAATVANYADAVKNKDSQKVCDNLDKRLIALTIDAVDPKTDGTKSTKSCKETFDTVLNSAETNAVVSEGINVKDLAGKSTEVSATMFSFPASAISADSTSTLFVGNIDGAWKITFDPSEEEAVKQLEASKATPKATASPTASTPAP